ncbi:hypothetical protein LSAT2_014723 [Lamellibrachia satsuma]|nr:hypothetical protein LSAT2_014723 [Lamellibrachia satsuma]
MRYANGQARYGSFRTISYIWIPVAVQLTTQESFMMVVSISRSTVWLLLLVMMTGNAMLLPGLMPPDIAAYNFNSKKCSGKPYTKITHICCEDHLYKLADMWARSSCCYGKPYNPGTQVCCGRERIMIKEWVKAHKNEC